MLHFTFQNMRAFYGPWPRGLGLSKSKNLDGTMHVFYNIQSLAIQMIMYAMCNVSQI